MTDSMIKWRNELGSIISKHGYTSGVELGVYMGKSYSACLKQNPQLHLTGIDNWQPSPGYPRTKLLLYELICKAIQLRHFYHARIIKGDAMTCASFFDDHSLDFLHYDLFNMRTSTVDFHHKILRCWVVKIKEGGMLIGRDLSQPDLLQALDSLGFGESIHDIYLGKKNKNLSYIIINSSQS